jgi:hypothetical protein
MLRWIGGPVTAATAAILIVMAVPAFADKNGGPPDAGTPPKEEKPHFKQSGLSQGGMISAYPHAPVPLKYRRLRSIGSSTTDEVLPPPTNLS